MQLAIKALELKGEVITTPFTYAATTTALLWENCKPVFVDIDPTNFCIDPFKIESKITVNTEAILATHVFGHPCNVKEIELIAKKHGLKVIYDGAHAFSTQIDSGSIFKYGDVSTCSFHATKLFHTIEGGCIVTNSDELAHQITLYRQFGHIDDEHFSIGINGKNSEFHAAMGLCNIKYIAQILKMRQMQWIYYEKQFLSIKQVKILAIPQGIDYNCAYFPIVFSSEKKLIQIVKVLNSQDITPRRYFYPSLNELPYLQDHQPCPISESISKSVLCLPLFHKLNKYNQERIVDTILKELI